MDEFRAFLHTLESRVPDGDKLYFRNVVKPVYSRLMDEVEHRFELIGEEYKKNLTENAQSLLVTGCIDIGEYRNSVPDCFEPVIRMNDNVCSVTKPDTDILDVELNSRDNNYLFSFICVHEYDEYMKLNGQEFDAYDVGSGNTIKMVFRHNREYIMKEKWLKKLFLSNRPQSSYYELPFFRRIIDVYSCENIKKNTRLNLEIRHLPGRIGIPVWNLRTDGNACNGSRKNMNLNNDKRIMMPYGFSGERNQYAILFENCNDDMLDGLIELKDYKKCKYMFSYYDKEDRVLKLFTNDRNVWGDKFYVHCLMPATEEDKKYLWYCNEYTGLANVEKHLCMQKQLTEAGVMYYVNIFREITGLETRTVRTVKGTDEIQIEFVPCDSEKFYMCKEYMDFLLDLVNTVFGGFHFEGKVVSIG